MSMLSDKEIADFLASIKTIAVVGLSEDPAKDSHVVGSYLQSQGYELVPVNPKARTVLGRKAYAKLADVEGKIDLVEVFRKSEEVAGIVDDAIAIGAKGIWLQLGIHDEVAEQKARKAGLFVISNCCLMVEHRRLLAHAEL